MKFIVFGLTTLISMISSREIMAIEDRILALKNLKNVEVRNLHLEFGLQNPENSSFFPIIEISSKKIPFEKKNQIPYVLIISGLVKESEELQQSIVKVIQSMVHIESIT